VIGVWLSTGKNDLEKKRCTMLFKLGRHIKALCASKDSPDYGQIKKESKEQEEGEKRCGLYDRAPKQTSAKGQKTHAVGPKKSHGMKMVRLGSENMLSQLMVSLLCIFHALYPLPINSFPQ
jgi:hypothetical protein